MKAIIKDVQKNGNDINHPQVDIIVEFQDKEFPADHHYPDGGSRQFIFTLPYEKFSALDEAELEKMVRAQGESFKGLLEKAVEAEAKKDEFASLINREYDI